MFKEGVTSDTGEKLKPLAVWYSKRVRKHLFLVIAITLLCFSPHCFTMLIICPLQPTPSIWSLLYLQLGFLHQLPFSVQSVWFYFCSFSFNESELFLFLIANDSNCLDLNANFLFSPKTFIWLTSRLDWRLMSLGSTFSYPVITTI